VDGITTLQRDVKTDALTPEGKPVAAGGSGLGLSIAENLMKLMGGTLKLSVDGDLFKVIYIPCSIPSIEIT
jgi:hypothetical protein